MKSKRREEGRLIEEYTLELNKTNRRETYMGREGGRKKKRVKNGKSET